MIGLNTGVCAEGGWQHQILSPLQAYAPLLKEQ